MKRMDLREGAMRALAESDPARKAGLATALQQSAARLGIARSAPSIAEPVTIPGRPVRPALVHPARVPKRSPNKPEGLAALLHAIAHIEFNAINLALDAVWRFDAMPREFYLDWTRVASEEAYHFALLADHLRSLGYAYGDFDAHDGLWAMCEKTKDDVVARMALVPRTLEARGLDATPQIQEKLRQAGTPEAMRAVEILDVILRDEVGHVAVGNHWYRWLCDRDGLDAVAHYGVLVERYAAPTLRPPFNEDARLRAGFSQEELSVLRTPRQIILPTPAK
jgi:uncharacterized ferritin-like protein (DUF455 family)